MTSTARTGAFARCAYSAAALLILLTLAAPDATAQAGTDAADTLARGIAAYRDEEYDTAFALLGPLAETGQVRAQVTVGLMYEKGQGVAPDIDAAVRWFELAAEHGNAMLRHDLGVKYFKGEGIPQDYASAARWWQLSADEGLAQSQYDLGVLYYRGLGVEQDYQRAAQLYADAAGQEHVRAQYSLAVMFALGRGLSRDYAGAADWFRRAAEQGDALSQYNLGLLLENGWGVPADRELAVTWFRRAAGQQLEQAQTRLADLGVSDGGAVSTAAANDAEPSGANTEPARTAAAPAVARVAAPPSPPPVATTSASRSWVRDFDPTTYTLQLASLTDESAAKSMLARLDGAGQPSGIAVYDAKGLTRYAVLFGAFDDRAGAEAAGASLPPAFAGIRPWVRRFGDLHAIERR